MGGVGGIAKIWRDGTLKAFGMDSRPPDAPPPATPPPAPVDLSDKAIQEAARRERERQRGSPGRKSTFLTGTLGDSSAVSSTLKAMLGS